MGLASVSPGSWNAHWKAQGHPWRTEPVIDGKRQQYLAEHLAVTANTMARYPFQDVDLRRPDIEWLLATYTFGYRPVGQRDGDLHKHKRLDLRGAHLGKVNLSSLPLDGMDLGGAHLEGADLSEVHLEGANLNEAYVQRAYLSEAHLSRRKSRAWGRIGMYLMPQLLEYEVGVGQHDQGQVKRCARYAA